MFWAPSNGYSGNIRFEATVAESYDVYWNNVNSKYVNIGDAPEIEENAAAGVGAIATLVAVGAGFAVARLL